MKKEEEAKQAMSESSTNTITRARVDNIATQNSEPNWLKEARLEAWETYLQTPMPNSRDEDWRRTEIDALDLSKLNALDLHAPAQKEQPKKLPSWFQSALTHIEPVAFIAEAQDSSFASDMSEDLQAKGVVFETIEQALAKHQELIAPYLTKQPTPEVEGKFGLMNKALFNSGIFLFVPKGVVIDGAFLTLLHATLPKGDQGVATFARVIVVAGDSSRLNLVNVLSSDGRSKGQAEPPAYSLANTSIEVHVGQNAKVNYVELQNFGRDIFAVTGNYNHVARDGVFNGLTVGLGGGQLKSDLNTVLSATGAASDIQGVVLGAANEHFSFNTIQEHASPDTSSNINFKVALKDTSSSVYQGIIKVNKIAQRTNAFQSNKNLLLGNEARADSIPKLEILADDVKCSHGATVGPVDREQIFYLMSRGVSASAAEELIVSGFFRQVLETCTISGATDWIFDLVAKKIHASN